MSNKSMVDVAYDIMASKKRAVAFSKLWQDVSKATGVSNDRIGEFYSDLSLDGRFLSLKDNKWDLKNRRKFEESQVDIASIEVDDDEHDKYDEDGNIINEDEDY